MLGPGPASCRTRSAGSPGAPASMNSLPALAVGTSCLPSSSTAAKCPRAVRMSSRIVSATAETLKQDERLPRRYAAPVIEGPYIAEIASLVGDPTRANMLAALMSGQALTATELTIAAGVTPQTASGHLA